MILEIHGADQPRQCHATEPLLRNAAQAATIFNRDYESRTVVRGIYTAVHKRDMCAICKRHRAIMAAPGDVLKANCENNDRW